MKERPIIFNTQMVKAILEGRKTQTRRVIVLCGKAYKFMREHGYDSIQHDEVIYPDGGGNWIGWDKDIPGLAEFTKEAYPNGEGFKCPYGQVGEKLWVRETLYRNPYFSEAGYVADNSAVMVNQTLGDALNWRWKSDTLPAIFMPKEATRITLDITEIRVERLQEITDTDAVKEGIANGAYAVSPIRSFQKLWDSLNEKQGYRWKINPWVWVISFRALNLTGG